MKRKVTVTYELKVTIERPKDKNEPQFLSYLRILLTEPDGPTPKISILKKTQVTS